MNTHKNKKNIEILFFLNLLLIILVMISSHLITDSSRILLTIIILPALFFMPILIVIKSEVIVKYIIPSVVLTFFFLIILGLCLRGIKEVLPYSRILGNYAIGYDHYYNYPLNFDLIILYCLMAIPFISVLIVWLIRKNK